jgi:hypothetical protein
MRRPDARQRAEFGGKCGQRFAKLAGMEVLGRARTARQGLGLRPGAQDGPRMAGLRAEVTQAMVQLVEVQVVPSVQWPVGVVANGRTRP